MTFLFSERGSLRFRAPGPPQADPGVGLGRADKPDPKKFYHVMFSRRQAANHVLFSSPKGAKDESLHVFYFVLSIFRVFVVIF